MPRGWTSAVIHCVPVTAEGSSPTGTDNYCQGCSTSVHRHGKLFPLLIALCEVLVQDQNSSQLTNLAGQTLCITSGVSGVLMRSLGPRSASAWPWPGPAGLPSLVFEILGSSQGDASIMPLSRGWSHRDTFATDMRHIPPRCRPLAAIPLLLFAGGRDGVHVPPPSQTQW